MRFRFNKNKSQPEKITKYSIRKFHFGAASVAVASLLFFGNGSVQAADNVVSPATGNQNTHQSELTTSSGGNSSGDSGSVGKPDAQAAPAATQVAPTTTATTVAKPTTPAETEKATEAPKTEVPSATTPATEAVSSETTPASSTKQNEAGTASEQPAPAATNEAEKAEEKTAEPKVDVTALQTALTELEDKLSKLKEESKKDSYKTLVTETKKVVEDHEVTKETADKQLELVKTAIKEVEEAIKKEAEQAKEESPTPKKRGKGQRGTENSTPKEEPKALPTYTNGTDNYALAEEMRKIVTYLRKNGADESEIASIKANYDKLNEKLGLTDENAVLSEADFATATANLKAARDYTEAFLRKQDENGQPSNEQPTVPGTERSVGDGASRTERAADDRVRDPRFPNAYTTPYATAKEFYYEDGQKGSSPYDKYTYLFHTFTESLVANNATHSPVRDVKRLVYEEVNEVDGGGYLWTITFNAAHEDQQDGYAFFSIPKGQRVDNSSITIERTPQVGVAEEVAGAGDLGSRVRTSLFRGKEIGIRGVAAGEESLEGLARGTANVGYYTRR